MVACEPPISIPSFIIKKSVCYNSSIKAKEMVMCPKCKGLLVPMGFPDEEHGVKCLSCGKYYYHEEPLEYTRNQGMTSGNVGRDVYTTSDHGKEE